MKDLGQQLYNQHRFNFSRVFIRQIMFKCTGDEILLNCKVIFNEEGYNATLCVTYAQFNDLLMQNADSELKFEIPVLLGEALSMPDQKKFETSFQINLMKVFGRAMYVRGCRYHTDLISLPMEELVEKPDEAFVFLVRRMTFLPALR